MIPNFADQLNHIKSELEITQREMCKLLFNVPHRTLQSWLQKEKEPPKYVQKLILYRLKSEKAKNK